MSDSVSGRWFLLLSFLPSIATYCACVREGLPGFGSFPVVVQANWERLLDVSSAATVLPKERLNIIPLVESIKVLGDVLDSSIGLPHERTPSHIRRFSGFYQQISPIEESDLSFGLPAFLGASYAVQPFSSTVRVSSEFFSETLDNDDEDSVAIDLSTKELGFELYGEAWFKSRSSLSRDSWDLLGFSPLQGVYNPSNPMEDSQGLTQGVDFSISLVEFFVNSQFVRCFGEKGSSIRTFLDIGSPFTRDISAGSYIFAPCSFLMDSDDPLFSLREGDVVEIVIHVTYNFSDSFYANHEPSSWYGGSVVPLIFSSPFKMNPQSNSSLFFSVDQTKTSPVSGHQFSALNSIMLQTSLVLPSSEDVGHDRPIKGVSSASLDSLYTDGWRFQFVLDGNTDGRSIPVRHGSGLSLYQGFIVIDLFRSLFLLSPSLFSGEVGRQVFHFIAIPVAFLSAGGKDGTKK